MGIFDKFLSTQNVNIARFARNVECDFLGDFQTLCSPSISRFFLKHFQFLISCKFEIFFQSNFIFREIIALHALAKSAAVHMNRCFASASDGLATDLIKTKIM